MFLSLIPEIKGESTDKEHKDQIDVLAWSWGMANSGTTHVGGAGGVRLASFQDLSLTKYVDKASPALMQKCANGGHLTTATLIVRKAGASPVEYIKIKLEEVLVSGVATGGSGGEDRLTENVSLNFGKVSLTYRPVSNPAPPTGPQFTWDIPSQSPGTNSTGTVPTPATGLTSTLTYTNGSPMARLTWGSTTGVGYQVWMASDLNTAFQPYGSPMPSAGSGTTSVVVPADAVRKFFRIETLPVQ